MAKRAPKQPAADVAGTIGPTTSGEFEKGKAPPAEPMPSPNAKTWKRLINLRNSRRIAKAEEQDHIKHRKMLEAQIDELGSNPTKKRMELTNEHYDVEQAIDKCRIATRWFADQMDQTIDDCLQGKLVEDDEDPIPPDSLFEKKKPKPAKGEKGAAKG